MMKSLDFAKKPNPEGEKLKDTFSYDKMLDNLLEICGI